ncbi:MAG: Cys-Gln thioester bond-forming surface protein [Pseudomonadales bacterium]|jgi:hypothetical protein|nr:Cys-Gln thioester bond-forming surface protein [Pseudomonadales bacterium]
MRSFLGLRQFRHQIGALFTADPKIARPLMWATAFCLPTAPCGLKARTGSPLRALARFLTLLAVAAGPSVVAAQVLPGGTGPYTVDVTYDDSIVIDYRINGTWHRSHVSVRGAYETANSANIISSQLYCLDPNVPYRIYANAAPGSSGVANYFMSGYTVVSLPDSPPTMPQSWNPVDWNALDWDAINWLVINGYRGDYYGNDAESQASVDRLQGYYPSLGGGITAKIAMMATKAAIWTIVGGSTFELLFPPFLSSTEQTVFMALVSNMVASATTAATTVPPAPSEFRLTLDESGATLGAPSGGYRYYGPITATAEVDNPGILLTPPILDKIFLILSGTDTAGIELVHVVGGASLPIDSLYGTTTPTPYISGTPIAFTNTGGNIWRTDNPDPNSTFYLKIPATRALGNNGLAIDAVAGIDDQPLALGGTPLIFIYENNLQQDWDAIQPFIGMASNDDKAIAYAQARLTRAGPPGPAAPIPALDLPALALLSIMLALLAAAARRRGAKTGRETRKVAS